MGDKGKKRYDDSFKREAVRLVFNSGKSVPAIAKDLGVSDSALYLWKRAGWQWDDAIGEGEPAIKEGFG
jgi:transposase-like protein